jgi:hypothetical protein
MPICAILSSTLLLKNIHSHMFSNRLCTYALA